MSNDITFTESSGNIFADLGFDDPEYELNRADLAIRIAKLIRERSLSTKEAARLMEADEANVSAILRGHLSDVPVDRLMSYLALLGQDVEIVVQPAATPLTTGRVTVRTGG